MPTSRRTSKRADPRKLVIEVQGELIETDNVYKILERIQKKFCELFELSCAGLDSKSRMEIVFGSEYGYSLVSKELTDITIPFRSIESWIRQNYSKVDILVRKQQKTDNKDLDFTIRAAV